MHGPTKVRLVLLCLVEAVFESRKWIFMPAWHGHCAKRPSHFRGSCIWNADSKIKPKLSETFLDITWAFLVCSTKKPVPVIINIMVPSVLLSCRSRNGRKTNKRHEKKSIAFEQAGNCLRHHYHKIPFAERDKTRIHDLLCCIWEQKQMYCFNQSNYRKPVKVPTECDPCCANKPDFLSKVGLVTDCRQYNSVPMATCCMTNKTNSL